MTGQMDPNGVAERQTEMPAEQPAPTPSSSSKMEIICAHLLTRLLETNDRLLPPDASAPPAPVTRFDARSIPAITVEAYLARILRYAPCEPDVLILVLIHLERLSKRKSIFVNSWNVHRLLITSFMIGAKYSSDTFFTNTHYAKVGGLPTPELNKLEMEFLASLNFELGTSPYELHRTYELLLNHCYAYPDLMALAEPAELERIHRQSLKYRDLVMTQVSGDKGMVSPISPPAAPVAAATQDETMEEKMEDAAGSVAPFSAQNGTTLPTPPASPDSPIEAPLKASLGAEEKPAMKTRLPMPPPPVVMNKVDVTMRNNSAPLLHFGHLAHHQQQQQLYQQQYYMQQQQQQKYYQNAAMMGGSFAPSYPSEATSTNGYGLPRSTSGSRPLTTMMDHLKQERASSMSPSMKIHPVFSRQTCRSIDHYPAAATEPWRQGSPLIGSMRS